MDGNLLSVDPTTLYERLGTASAPVLIYVRRQDGAFSVSDRTFPNEGHIALWTEDDNVTRFDEIAITPYL